ncbi:hypothetical protein AX17_001106 [Amanita inopinata Kibby_2008]|nr:hypothetical protein AX17_001106 [Amanita inopinata Kibby_2008]
MKPIRSLSNPSVPPLQKRPRLAQGSPSFKPIRVASSEAADAVDADPPLRRLEALHPSLKQPPKGDAIVYWMRMGDLRLNDNRALSSAAEQAACQDAPLVVLFIFSPEDYIAHDRGARRIDFMLRNLKLLKSSLSARHIPLYTITQTPRPAIPSQVISFLSGLGCNNLYANIEYEVDELRRDLTVCDLAKLKDIRVVFSHDKCIIEPGVILTGESKPYAIFSPYHRKWIARLNENIDYHIKEHPFNYSNKSSVRSSRRFSFLFDSEMPDLLTGFELDSHQRQSMITLWPAGEQAANTTLQRFLRSKSRLRPGSTDSLSSRSEESETSTRVSNYARDRDRADGDTTSKLSPYLCSGVLSARACIREIIFVQQSDRIDGTRKSGIGRWLQEIAWRDFYVGIIAAHPRVSMGRPYLEKFASLVWENHRVLEESGVALQRWKQGTTGIPIVDAAMRCLKETGWVHNRLRMISAMYLTKDLMIDWRVGERYFMEQLIDGDLASNNGGWQWCASTGVDACPYFRIFNPYSQSPKVDPSGDFIRHWVPELKNLKGLDIHNPPAPIAEKLGYPRPVVEHGFARDRALRRYKNPGKA